MSDKNKFTYIIVVIFTLALLGEYAIINNQIQRQNQLIEELETTINELNDQLLDQNQVIEELEIIITELTQLIEFGGNQDEPSAFLVSELPGLTIVYEEDFENIETGSLPINWTQIYGTSLDYVNVTNETGYNSEKCLQLTENGHDGENCQIRFDFGDYQKNMVLDLYLQAIGSPADRAVLYFITENNEWFGGLASLLGYRWEFLGPDHWATLQPFTAPIEGKWYHVQVVFDRDSERINYIIDGLDSGWQDSRRPWETFSRLDIKGNYNYPATSRFDKIVIYTYDG